MLNRFLLPVFGATIFLSAFLLFSIQPLFAKMVLPKLGGAPAVWSVAMVFFQSLLLLGYLYAHALEKYVPVRTAIIIHLVLTAAALLTLPITLAAGFGRPPVDGQIGWLIALFTISIGLPFFALSGNGPLLQAWFARTQHAQAKDPYFLYSSSNLGSLLALLCYPFLWEPNLTLRLQSLVWTYGYAALLGLLALTGALLYLQPLRKEKTATESKKSKINLQDRLKWTALAFVPSGLLIAVTAYISTDIAAFPFLWIVPLILYLLTFIIVFARRPLISQGHIVLILPFAIVPLLMLLASGYFLPWTATLLLNLLAFFLIAMRCHGLLAESRPPAANLTEFYLFLSLGGVLGGLFSGLLAPHVFSNIIEYPLLIIAGTLSLPGFTASLHGNWQRDAGFALAALVLAIAGGLIMKSYEAPVKMMWLVVMTIIGAAMIADRTKPLRFFIVAAGALLIGTFLQPADSHMLTMRSFFGVHKVHDHDTENGAFRVLEHGTTLHGAQAKEKTRELEPITYYAKENNFGQVLQSLRKTHTLKMISVTGLGTGSLACRREKGEAWSFFEIDPAVVSLARSQFTFLRNCAPDARMTLGDARLTLADEPDRHYDLLIIDAFNSDAVPVHLLTLEALQMYFTKLKLDGVLLLHISNRNLEMENMLATSAAALNLVAYARAEAGTQAQIDRMVTPSHVVVMARKQADLGPLTGWEGWRRLQPSGVIAWRDDYSDILGSLWRKFTIKPPFAAAKAQVKT